MSTPQDVMARELRNELDARVNQWKAERERLLQAPARIAELDALIAYAENDTRTEFPVAPRTRTAPTADTEVATTPMRVR